MLNKDKIQKLFSYLNPLMLEKFNTIYEAGIFGNVDKLSKNQCHIEDIRNILVTLMFAQFKQEQDYMYSDLVAGYCPGDFPTIRTHSRFINMNCDGITPVP